MNKSFSFFDDYEKFTLKAQNFRINVNKNRNLEQLPGDGGGENWESKTWVSARAKTSFGFVLLESFGESPSPREPILSSPESKTKPNSHKNPSKGEIFHSTDWNKQDHCNKKM